MLPCCIVFLSYFWALLARVIWVVPRGTIQAQIVGDLGGRNLGKVAKKRLAYRFAAAVTCAIHSTLWIISSEINYNLRGVYPFNLCPSTPAISSTHGLSLRGMAECFAPATPCAWESIPVRSTHCAIRESFSPLAEGCIGWQRPPPLTHPDWVAVASRIPRAVICLISALAHHELTTQVPHNVEIALPSHAQVPRVQGIPVRVFWFPNRAFNAGIDVITIDRLPVRIYSPEKTIADCFKYRHKIGIDVAVEALRTYREKVRRLPVNKLLEYARICRVEKVMRPYLEVVL